MRRAFILVTIFFLLTGSAVASSHTAFEPDPGLVQPDSPIYGLELAWENVAVSIGLTRASDVLQERVAEAGEMVAKGKPEAAMRAAEDMTRIAKKADADEAEAIDRAMEGLQNVMTRMEEKLSDAPNEEAREGMENALNNMQDALDKMELAKRGQTAGDTQDIVDVGNCEQEIGIAQDHGSRDQVDCTAEFQEMQCDDDTSVTYGARNGCEINALESMNWTPVTRENGALCDTSTCTWETAGCGNHGCPAGKMAEVRSCTDENCQASKTRCVDAMKCPADRPPAVEKIPPQPQDDAFVEIKGSHRFTKSPSIQKDQVVEFANHADDEQDHTITVDGEEFQVEWDWVVHLKFNRTGTYTVDCTTCSGQTQTTVTVK